jgi:4-hydroxybenzoate polyprenyltransferase
MLQILISFIFYVSFVVFIFLGVYGIVINKKERLNHVFFFLCLGFSVWAFTFAIFNSARTYEEALLW